MLRSYTRVCVYDAARRTRYLPLERCRTAPICTLLPIVLLGVGDTLYPLHSHVALRLELLRMKRKYGDFRTVRLWHKTLPLYVLQVPCAHVVATLLRRLLGGRAALGPDQETLLRYLQGGRLHVAL
jgi:hypothetical protein